MTFRVEATTGIRAVENQDQKKQITNVGQQVQAAHYSDQKALEVRSSGAIIRKSLEAKFAQQANSPYKALEQINALPKPDTADTAAVKAYKQKRADIAARALQHAQPPTLADFKNLPPRLAAIEYSDARASYAAQISELQKIYAEAKAYPDRILTPSEALDEIAKLPRPDRNDPNAILEYNRRRAEIANAALMYAEPPKREDFKGLNPRLADYEYREAKAYYDSQISQLRDAANAAYSRTPPAITDAEATRAADEIINRHGGRDQLDADAVGRALAEIAKRNPNDAAIIGQKILDKITGTTKEDNVSKAFVNNLSDEELRRIAQDSDGKQFLERAKEHMLSGSVHSEEVDAAGRIDEAITGLDPQSLNGDPEHDARVIDEQLQKLPPEMRESFVKAVLEHPYGREALRYAATMSTESQKALGETLGKLYRQNPSETMKLLREITDAPRGMPYYYQSGMAKVIAQSGNDDLIKAFAQHEIDKAKQDPDQIRGYLNAVTAWSGLSPNALQDVMKNNPDFYKAVEEAGKLTQGPGNVSGFPNYNILEPGLGDLLKKASQIKGADGQTTPEALKLFATAVKYADSNLATQEGAGAFFIEHARQVIDTYTDPRNGGPDKANSFNPEVLQTFFANVVYAPDSEVLQYKGKPLVDFIMGDGKGKGGVLGDVVEAYLNEARRPNETEAGRENDQYIGEKIGYLWGAVSGGLLDSVKAYKAEFEEDKELRDFSFGLLKRGLGEIAKKFGIPGEVLDQALDAGQKIYEAGKEDEKEAQLDKFTQAFNEISDSLLSYVTNFEVNTPNVEGLQVGFLAARTDYLTRFLVNEWIGQ